MRTSWGQPFLAGALACALLARAPHSLAAPKKQQQCIASAESGQQLRSSGKLLEARKAFGVCTQNVCPAIIRRDCGRWIDEVDNATPTITVKLEGDAGADVSDGLVQMDGEPLPRADGRATPVNPGVHKFVWARDAGNVEQELVVREGEHNRVIVLRVPSPGVVGPPPPKPEDTPVPVRRHGALPFVLGGLGIAVAGTGAALWGLGLSDRSQLESTCVAAHACSQHDVNVSKSKLIVGDVMVGLGVVALAAAIYVYVSQGSVPASTAATR